VSDTVDSFFLSSSIHIQNQMSIALLPLVAVALQGNIPPGRSLHVDMIRRWRRHMMNAAVGYGRLSRILPTGTSTGKATIRR
jgi:hypothetical protein